MNHAFGSYTSEHKADIKALLELQEVLYETGARNFMFIDVPPMNRAPCSRSHFSVVTFSLSAEKTMNSSRRIWVWPADNEILQELEWEST